MINVRVQLPSSQPAISATGIVDAARGATSRMADAYPESEFWEVTAKRPKTRYDARDPLGRTMSAVIAVVALGRGAQTAVNDRITSLGTTLLTVSPGQARTGGVMSFDVRSRLTIEDAQALEGAAGCGSVHGGVSSRE